MDKSNLILMLSAADDDVLDQMKKIRLKKAKSKEYYVSEIKEIY
jgi:hypothetical protein